jgi:LysM repeat protein
VGPGLEPECGNCGARLPSGATRCHVCGAPTGDEHRQRRCPNCGTPAAQQAQTCLMCNAALDHVSVRNGLASVSWLWVGAVALVVALVVVGWNYWRNRPQPVAVAATATPTVAHILTPTRIATATTDLTPTSSPVPSPTPIIHEVQSGETLIYIASYYGTAVDALMEANDLDETSARMLLPGQRLLIPSRGPVGGPGSNAAAPPPLVIHEVKSGETLISIAIDHDTTVEAILDANDLDSPDLIYEGQQLLVPLMPPTTTPTLTPTPTPSSTPGPPYAAPHLLSPSDEAVFEGEEAAILLSWTSVAILQKDQAYLVELETPAQVTPITYTTQSTSWRLPSELRPTGRRRAMTWRVTVVQHANSTSDALPEWEPVSLPSETRHFVWW